MMLQDPQQRGEGSVPANKDVEKVAEQSEVVAGSKGRNSIRTLQEFLADAISAGPIEERGVMPVALEDRTATNYSSYFSIWACMNINLLP